MIHPIKPSDNQNIIRSLWSTFLLESQRNTPTTLKYIRHTFATDMKDIYSYYSKHGTFLLTFDGPLLIGFIGMINHKLQRLAVIKDYRGRGVAIQLGQAAIRNQRYVEATVDEHNIPAYYLLIKYGFVVKKRLGCDIIIIR